MGDGVHLFWYRVADAELLDLRCHVVKVEVAAGDIEHKTADAVDESACGRELRVVEDLFGCAFFQNDTLIHEKDAGADVAGEFHLVCDDKHGHFVYRQCADDPLHLPDHRGIKR